MPLINCAFFYSPNLYPWWISGKMGMRQNYFNFFLLKKYKINCMSRRGQVAIKLKNNIMSDAWSFVIKKIK